MAWERRSRGTRYYTRSKKIGGQVVREYVGGGVLGALAAQRDADGRAKIEQEARAWNALRVRLEQADAAAQELCEATEVAAGIVLVLAGYHQHHRGEWRKARGQGPDKSDGRRNAHPEEVQRITETSTRRRQRGTARSATTTATDRSDPQAADSRTLRFRVDLPANQLGPGWRKRA
jgi:hypothetical protein